ncbi:hypothetical protein [Pseudomonas yamanorum]|uniref:hypothetical protein n=1 Tax=Pseudomonas yamanorum TaxID=515393 RepID=UPI002ED4031F|nr:hypothetical protein VYI69_12165 [Pseudomonas yamanorum]
MIALLAVGVGGTFWLTGAPAAWSESTPQDRVDAGLRAIQFDPFQPLSLKPITQASLAAVVEGMPLSPGCKKRLNQKLATASHPQLAWISLRDTDAEDGDVVRVDSLEYSRTVKLTRAPLLVAVVVVDGGTLSITGIRDGDGNGITLGLKADRVERWLPVMHVGQVQHLTISLH